MMSKKDVSDWLRRIPDTGVAIDEGGLSLVGVTVRANGTLAFSGAYIEIGGVPEEEK